jgi:1-acyl-sn-glycerol-3-phosphate acyltransferase
MSEEHIPAELEGSQELEESQPILSDTDQAGSVAPKLDDVSRQELIAELDELVARLQEAVPDYSPPSFSPKRLMRLIEENMASFSPGISFGILQRLRDTLGEDFFDADTWRGVWFMVNYTLEYQADILRRRMNGEYETDEWGFDQEVLQEVEPFVDFMYSRYWRVETVGMEHVPDEGRAILVSNHSGQLPWDGVMLGMAVYKEHPYQRLVRNLYATWFTSVPFISDFLTKMGQVLANEDNGVRLLEQEELISVFPEGIKGVSKLFKDRYRLARFGRGGFVRMALKTGAPLIPVSIVGAEETYISLAKSSTIARMFGLPFFPITPTWPLLGPLGFVPIPTKWYIEFGEPIQMDTYGPDAVNNLVLVSQLTDQVRNIVQSMIYKRLAQRKSVFLG